MATTNLIIKNGQIVSHCDRYYVSLSENGKEYCGNGWVVRIKDGRKDRPGRIICHAEREYSDGPAVCHREFRLADGTLGLAGGNIYSRYAYFRSEDFQKFLADHNISAVKKEDPNTIFYLRNAWYGGGECSMSIRTDGKMEKLKYDSGRTEDWEESCPGTSAYEGETSIKVSGATWVIVDKVQHERDRHNSSHILYTLAKDATKLVGIPNERKKDEWKQEVADLVHSFDGSFELAPLEKALMEIFPGLEPKYQDPKREKVNVSSFAYVTGYQNSNVDTVYIDGSRAEIEEIRQKINASGVTSREELDKFCKANGLPVEPTRYYFFTHFMRNGDLNITYNTSTSHGHGYNGFDGRPWPTLKAPTF